MIVRGLHSLRRLLALLGGLALGGAAAAQPALPAAPDSWLAYAGEVSRTLPIWLAEDTAPAQRLRDHLVAMRPAPDASTPPVFLKLWVASDGTVSRIESLDVVDAQVDADLRMSLVGRRLPSAPPKDMRQPIRLKFQLGAPPAPAP